MSDTTAQTTLCWSKPGPPPGDMAGTPNNRALNSSRWVPRSGWLCRPSTRPDLAHLRYVESKRVHQKLTGAEPIRGLMLEAESKFGNGRITDIRERLKRLAKTAGAPKWLPGCRRYRRPRTPEEEARLSAEGPQGFTSTYSYDSFWGTKTEAEKDIAMFHSAGGWVLREATPTSSKCEPEVTDWRWSNCSNREC